ncbi:MAG: phosphotransferase [Methylocystaceae bacterium]|nr:phosphotransferase [Methylocystaceae bacterium]
MTICIVDNDGSFIREAKEAIDSLTNDAKIISYESTDELAQALDDPKIADSIEIVFSDLEFASFINTPGNQLVPKDYHGRDEILQILRRKTPWIPVVLISNYVAGHSEVLSKTTSWGFDAVLPKSFITEQSTSPKEWNDLISQASLSRIASLTGRYVHELSNALNTEIKIEAGSAVESIFNTLGEKKINELISLFGFEAQSITVDEIVQGFSGINVVKLNCETRVKIASWLFKFGEKTSKINDEICAHRKLFANGFTRKMAVPAYWWKPIFHQGVAAIAYEFDEGSKTLLDYLNDHGWEETEAILDVLFEEFYSRGTPSSIIPRKVLCKKVASEEEVLDTRETNKSVVIKKCFQHGDMHLRNILVKNNEGLLIDFAHFDAEGYPLIDLAKLLIDSWVFTSIEIELPDLVDGSILRKPLLEKLIQHFVIDTPPTDGEVAFFKMTVNAYLSKYFTYDDVSDDKKNYIANEIGLSST